MRTYRLSHRTSYAYDEPVSTSYGRAHLLPREHPGQTSRDARVTVTPAPAELREHTDFFGNRSTYFAVTTAHRRLDVLAESVVRVGRRRMPDGAATWERMRDALPGAVSPLLLDARAYVLPSPRLPADPAVTAYAAPSFTPGRPLDARLRQGSEPAHVAGQPRRALSGDVPL